MKIIVFIPEVEQNGYLIQDAVIDQEEVPVWLNFNRKKRIDTALLSKDEKGIIYADFDLNGNYKGYFPAIGGQYSNNRTIEVKEIGVCRMRNTDEKIKAIE